MDLSLFLRQLEFADFSTRERLAGPAARELSAEQLLELSRQLQHPQERVRLGVIEVLWRAGHRASLDLLLAHAQKRTGDDRVFAIRALAQLARPGDEALVAAVAVWLVSTDPFVSAQAKALGRALALSEAAPSGGSRPPSPAPSPAPAPLPELPTPVETVETLVAALLAARTDAERISLVSAIEARGPADLAAAAEVALPTGNADVVALICRALIRRSKSVPTNAAQALVPLLESARTRLADSFLALAALDDGLLALEGLALSPALLLRLARMDKTQLEHVLRRLHDRPPAELALQAPVLLQTLEERPALWPALGPILVDAAPHLREGARTQLLILCEAALSELRRGQELETITLLSLCWILAQVSDRGGPLCRQLRTALERLSISEASLAFCALCARLATEEAALALLSVLRDPLPEARTAAREALRGFQSPWVRISFEEGSAEEPTIDARYANAQEQPLSRKDGALVAVSNGEEYALDLRGRPIRVSETEHGACLCCPPPRALVRRRQQGLRCPASWEAYLREGGRVVREREHPFGRCNDCESPRPRSREGTRIVCLDCGAGRAPARATTEAPAAPDLPSEGARRSDEPEALPKPPTPQELELIAAHIRSAITANVFLLAQDGEARWSGSGIVVARDGQHLAILTNRHVVEDDQTKRLAALRALTVAGEVVEVSTIWRGARGVDLALVEARVEQADSLGVMAIGAGKGLVGAPVFVVGNPLGLAWSYTGGTLSAIRHWTTSEGQSVRILQTDAPIAPGSSGGGLFHTEGHLLGVVSFLRQGHMGGSAHFALSIDAIRDAFARESVCWRGRALLDAIGA